MPWAERAGAEDVRALHAVDRRKPRLHDPNQVVGDLVLPEEIRGEAQICGGKLAVHRDDIEDGDLGFGR